LISIGTSGYSFPDWVGTFYPTGTKRQDMLGFYSRHFRTVEVNSTYYRIPPPRVLEQMERKTPPGFDFIVKLNKAMTHEGSESQELYDRFLSILEPLEKAGKLGGVLAQFPWGFRMSEENLTHLGRMRDPFGRIPFFAEFRNSSWNSDRTFDFLAGNRIGFCIVDEPSLKGLMPPVVKATTEVAYVRFHGRNARNWWGRGGGDRYDYLYSEGELKDWAAKIARLADQVKKTYVFFNNCHAGQAARNAQMMKTLLGEDTGGGGDTLF